MAQVIWRNRALLMIRPMIRLCCAVALLVAASSTVRADEIALPTAGDTPAFSAEQLKFFESSVRPVLVARCQKCHSGESPKGELSLESRPGLLAGGESGEAISFDKPDESLIVEAINYASLEMPPDGKLSDEEIATLTDWVKQGAPWPDEPSGVGPKLRERRDKITDEDRAYWAFQPVGEHAPPEVAGDKWSRTPIDRFVLARMQQEGITPAAEADKSTLIRRLWLDMLGLPPTADEVASFVADNSSDAYERLVDRALASPHYGEHWARHWLDLVRYAESDGYKQDAYRPHAWRYRDYVIRALNSDKPYDQFVREQIAGDELAPNQPDALVAAGYYRLAVYEYNQRDVRTQWDNILNEITDVTADVFLGMGMSCARCHDHKFDPILQTDYFRLKSFFTPIVQHEEPLPESDADAQKRIAWEQATAEIRRELTEIERPLTEDAAAKFIKKFPADVEPIFGMPVAERAGLDEQICRLAARQITEEGGKIEFAKKLPDEQRKRWEELRKQLAEFDAIKPAERAAAMTVSDIGPISPATMIPGKRDAEDILPGVPTVLDRLPLDYSAPSSAAKTTGRRAALAQWLTRPEHPLTARVMVNRVWQQHFGRGLVETASDFGRLGQPPSHPELLDYLTRQFIESGWSLKTLHRQILLSATYRQASSGPSTRESLDCDPTNRWLARMTPRRLTAEQIRDSALLASGELDLTSGGPSVGGDKPRRSIYLKVMRNTRDSLLEAFDTPDATASVAQRNATTTPTQALVLINAPWMLERAKALAARVDSAARVADEEITSTRIRKAYEFALARKPGEKELAAADDFLTAETKTAALVDFCHVLLNSNEFVFVD